MTDDSQAPEPTSPLTAAAAVPLLVLYPSVYIWQKPCRSSQISRNLLLKTSGLVSALAKLLSDKSTDGWLIRHGGTLEIHEIKMSFCVKPKTERADLIRTFVKKFCEPLIESTVVSWIIHIWAYLEQVLWCKASSSQLHGHSWVWIGSSIRRYDFLAEPQTMAP